jgi:hypothetical protein
VLQKTPAQLQEIRGVGPGGVEYLLRALARHGLTKEGQ